MPIYEYRCDDCGHELERIQKMSDEKLKDCPACEKPQLRRLISAAGFRLKGAGWYETDFKQSGKRNLADSGNEPPGDSKSAAKSTSDTANGSSEKAPVKKPADTASKSSKETKSSTA
jgi:putative FmdB family regulatory protein